MEPIVYEEVKSEAQVRELYALNRELAEKEGQGELFQAEFSAYREAFLGSCPAARGWLISAGKERAGFAIVLPKFASYLAKVTAYIEDLYLRDSWAQKGNYLQVLRDLGERFRNEGAYRVEIRMLQKGVLDAETLREAGFAPVEKWQVWRMEQE
ncbi:hypothetical protein [Nitratifractor sp.]